MDPETLQKIVIEKLSQVIDPETGADVIRMRLIQDLQVDESGRVSYVFRPSSPLCPIAVHLSVMIMQAVSEVPEVKSQSITVVDYIQADTLNELLRSLLEP